eukprot:scaffold17153_cov12-Tisochrysis_lutea.AAC.1
MRASACTCTGSLRWATCSFFTSCLAHELLHFCPRNTRISEGQHFGRGLIIRAFCKRSEAI